MDVKRKKQLSIGVILSYITIIIQCLSGIIYTPIILKSFGQSIYGVYSLCTSFSGYLNIFDGGMNAAFVRFYVQVKTKNRDKIPALNGLFARIFIVLAFCSLAVGLVISWKAEVLFGSKINLNEYELLKKLFVLLSFNMGTSSLNCIFSSLVISNERFAFGKMINLLKIIMEPLIAIPMLLNGYGAVAIFVIKLLLTVLITAFNALYCFSKLKTKFEFSTIDKMLLKSILVFAGAIALQLVMDQLNWQIDKIILAWTNGTSEISIYSVGSTFNNYYTTIAAAMSGVFIAEINRLVAEKKDDELSGLFVRCARIFSLLIFLIMSGYCIFGNAFITRWAGSGYNKSFTVGLLLMIPVTPSLIFGLGQDIVRAKNAHKIQIYINFAVCICNFFISIPLAKSFGAVGSAIGTFLSEFAVCVVIEAIYYHKVARLNMKLGYAQVLYIMRGLIGPVIYGIIILKSGLIRPTYISVLINVLAYMVVYAISMWFLAMNDYEKGLVKNVFARVIGRLKFR